MQSQQLIYAVCFQDFIEVPEILFPASTVNHINFHYDVYSLLGVPDVVTFIGTQKYLDHKEKRFPVEDFDLPIRENEAFLFKDKNLRHEFQKRYESTKALYYKGQPTFEELLKRIHQYLDIL
ncbi:hypothetical protein [Pseudoflavitalea rhizosphaerae]|uniref:hypothetical protein n=1 Tax=Pseudoflavitalea rhizosphaerae TaxID=1884793 RepID=UPI000F8CDD2A|nr:hypothetical protein [Pseudoflavitalea rhizosphaerae]